MSDLDLRGRALNGCVFDRVLFLGRAHIDNFRGALLHGCDLAGCELGGVDFQSAKVAGASFVGATAASPASLSGVVGLDAFPLGSTDTVGAGSLVAIDGFLLTVTAGHPTNPAYAYYRRSSSTWARASMDGCFEKRHCRLLG